MREHVVRGEAGFHLRVWRLPNWSGLARGTFPVSAPLFVASRSEGDAIASKAKKDQEHIPTIDVHTFLDVSWTSTG